MRRFFLIPGLLLGLIFAGGGFFVFTETALPMWQSWQRMQDWRPAYARLLSVAGDRNQIRARYRYEYGGQSFEGSRVGVSEFRDNIGAYQRDLQRYLRGFEDSRELLPIWVNPDDPTEAVIDREMRWGLFALASAFCGGFVFIGLVIVYASLRAAGRNATPARPSLRQLHARWREARDGGEPEPGFLEFVQRQAAESPATPPAPGLTSDWRSRDGWGDEEIYSDAGKGSLVFWGFAIFWNAISTPLLFVLPDELARGNTPALLGLLFPIIGLVLIGLALRRTLELRRFGRVPLRMDPYPGSIGGHVGGSIRVQHLDYAQAGAAKKIEVTLECVYSYISGSGENRSRRESIKWAERGRPRVDRGTQGVVLSFRFDVPAGLPEADVQQQGAYHLWRLRLAADLPGIDLDRSYNLPVFATGESSRAIRHDISAQAAAERRREADAAGLAIASGRFDIEGLSRALRLQQEGDRTYLYFPMLRKKLLTLFMAVFAGGFGFASYSMLGMIAGGGLFGIAVAVFAVPFFAVAVVAGLATIYLPLNNLAVWIRPGEVFVRRRLWFFPIFRRHLERAQIDRLELRRSGSTGEGVDRVEHFRIRAVDAKGRKTTLAEDIDGEDVAGHFRDYLARRIGVSAQSAGSSR